LGERQTAIDRAAFSLKVTGLQALRAWRDVRNPVTRWKAEGIRGSKEGQRTEVRSALFVDGRSEEYVYECGKVENLRVAARRLNGVTIPAGEVFSFWRQVGRPSVRKGFVPGRMLQLGCVVPAAGGGLCQLSNALYELALESGFTIVERHAHSHRLPGTPLRDATVAWNYIDLRFRVATATRLEVTLTETDLVVAFVCDPVGISGAPLRVLPRAGMKQEAAQLVTCGSCHQISCALHEPHVGNLAKGRRTAFLVDDFWPEFDRYLQMQRRPGDVLMLPIDGKHWGQTQYGWSCDGFAAVKTHNVRTLVRAARVRRLANQGAARQSTLLHSSVALANAMAAQLTPSIRHLVLDQTLLPGLWQSGVLGGRTFQVMLRRLPLKLLQARLDEVAARWPESVTAADFRVGAELVETEAAALAAASGFVTPHRELAGLYPDRTVLLDWILPPAGRYRLQDDGDVPRILFPGPTTARKGAYLLREALRGLDVELVWQGAELEGAGFWQGFPTRCGSDAGLGVAMVVQPAFVEHRPRALLQAVEDGVPVLAAEACGLGAMQGVTTVPLGDIAGIRQALIEVCQDVLATTNLHRRI
jgi:hypothetical protein